MPPRSLTLLAATALSTGTPAFAQQSVPETPTPPSGASVPAPEDDAVAQEGEAETGTEVTVVGQRERGSVPGDIQPEQVLRPGDIRSYGVNSISDLIAELSPQLGSGRGTAGGQPVLLLNGRRISSFRQISNYPAEAIERTEILPPEAAQQLGYRAEQRVINIVLRRRFNSLEAEVRGGAATGGDRYSTQDKAGLLRIMRDKQLNLTLNYSGQTPVYEADRDIIPTTPARPYSITGNLTPGTGLTQIDPALSALAGSPLTVAGVPEGLSGRPPLSAFLGGANPSQFSDYRTVSAAQQQFQATASYAQPISRTITGAVTAEFDWTKTDSAQGLATASLAIPSANPFSPFGSPVTLNRYLVEGGPREQAVESNRSRLSFAVNGDIDRWRWSADGNYERRFSSTFTDTGFDLNPLSTRLAAGDPAINPFAFFAPSLLGDMRQDYARSLRNRGEVTLQANGPFLALPAGDVRANLRSGFVKDDISGRSIRGGVVNLTDNGRTVGNGQVRIDVPIANRGRGVLSAIGNLSANGSYAFEQVSDFGWLSTYSGGVNWAPLPGKLFFLATVSRDDNAPEPEQLGNPAVFTPDVRVFDFVRGTSVDVVAVTGGNPNLLASQRRVTNLTLNARPFSNIDLNFNAEYTRRRTINPIETLSTPTAALEAIFPDRFLRDASGQLIRVDNRPINVDRSDQEQLRWGFNFSRRFGSTPPGGGGRGGFGAFAGRGAGEAPRPAAPTPAATVGSSGPEQTTPAAPATTTPPPTTEAATVSTGRGQGGGQFGAGPRGGGGFGGGGRGFGGGGFGGFGGTYAGLSVFHTWRFRDTLSIGPGIPVLDRLNGDATNIRNASRHQVEANGRITHNGYGLRANLRWQSDAFVRGGSARTPVDIRAEPFTTVGLNAFVTFNQTMAAVREHPWLAGSRLELGVSNLFDARQRITDANGTVPINFQPDLLDPVGRVVTLTFRKLFTSRPPNRGAGFGGAGALRR